MNIPSDDEFDKASKRMKGDFKDLEKIKKKMLCEIHNLIDIDRLYILPQKAFEYRVYIFFHTEEQKQKYMKINNRNILENLVYRCFEYYYTKEMKNIVLLYEYDSRENIDNNYEGNDLNRLR